MNESQHTVRRSTPDRALRLGAAAAVSLLISASGGYAQSFTEYPVPTAAANPTGIAFGPDGNLWFTERDANKIAKINTAGVVTEFPTLPNNSQGQGSQPLIIVVAPDGALYFTMTNASRIGKITTSGATSFFNSPTASTDGLTVGPDGNLWFTEQSANKIGKLNLPGGTVTEFTVPTANSQPARITLGPDGNLWFSESQANKIGRITPAGVITEFAIPTANSRPWVMRGFYDGNVYFTERNASKIGVINTSGVVINEFATPTANADPVGLSFGPDGNLWFTELAGNKIARLGAGGNITEVSIPTAGGGPSSLIVGPDGALWFIEQTGNKIGRFVPLPGSIQLFAAVLPSSRSPQVGNAASAFATIINNSPSAATGCRPQPLEFLPFTSVYQTTDPKTNILTGTVNTPADIPANGSQTYVIGATPNAPFPPTDLRLGFACSNANAAPIVSGLDTLLISASTTPVPDIVALSATLQNDGILHISGNNGASAFSVATSNVGATGVITATPTTAGQTLPLALTICQTNSASGQCLAAPTASVSTAIPAGGTPTFAIFGTASGAIANLPQTNRIVVQFADVGGAVRGATSVAVRTE